MRYLVVAHQTATSQALVDAVRSHAAAQPNAEFVLLVPATRVEHLLTWTEGESREVARRAGERAQKRLRAAGVRVTAVRIGDASPLQAIDDELRGDPAYDKLIISTMSPQTSRWLRMDVIKQAERRFGRPVIPVVAQRTTGYGLTAGPDATGPYSVTQLSPTRFSGCVRADTMRRAVLSSALRPLSASVPPANREHYVGTTSERNGEGIVFRCQYADRAASDQGFKMYPMPRVVWMSGVPKPRSILLRK